LHIISRFVLGFADINLVILQKNSKPFLSFAEQVPWQQLLSLVNPAQNLTRFQTADFRRDYHDPRFSTNLAREQG
jgi:hypothetical protein